MLRAGQSVERLLRSGRKCVAVGKNYRKHIDEMASTQPMHAEVRPLHPHTLPQYPTPHPCVTLQLYQYIVYGEFPLRGWCNNDAVLTSRSHLDAHIAPPLFTPRALPILYMHMLSVLYMLQVAADALAEPLLFLLPTTSYAYDGDPLVLPPWIGEVQTLLSAHCALAPPFLSPVPNSASMNRAPYSQCVTIYIQPPRM